MNNNQNNRIINIAIAESVKSAYTNKEFSFSEFVSELSLNRKIIPKKNKDYLELDKNSQRLLKDGKNYVFGKLDDTGSRKKENLLSREGLTYDLDNISIEDLNIIKNVLNESGYNYIVHSTASYDGNKPRIRVIIPFNEAIEPDQYKQLAIDAMALFAIPESVDVCSFEDTHVMYYPTVLEDVEPIFISVNDGDYLDPKDIKPVQNNFDDYSYLSDETFDDYSYLSDEVKEEKTQIEPLEAIKDIRSWAKREERNLMQYSNYIAALMVIAKAYQNKEIDYQTGIEVVKILACNNPEWVDQNIKDFEREIKNPNIKTEYSFKQKFMGGSLKESKAESKIFDQQIETALNLNNTHLKPITFYINKMLPAGIGWLAGEAKAGKSFMAMQMAYCISQGIPFLGFETKQSNVMYYSLEMGRNLVQNRLRTMFKDKPLSDRFSIAYKLKPFDKGGLKQLEKNMIDYNCKVAFIDMHGYVATSKSNQKELYSQSYEELSQVKQIAEKLDACIVLITHLNKNTGEDIMNRIMGSVGNRGAVDFTIGISKERESKQTNFVLESRKSTGLELVLEFNKDCNFTNIGTTDDIKAKQRYEDYLNSAICSAIKFSLLDKTKASLSVQDIYNLIPFQYLQDLTLRKIGRQLTKLEYPLKYYDKITFEKTRKPEGMIYEFKRPKNLINLTPILQGYGEEKETKLHETT